MNSLGYEIDRHGIHIGKSKMYMVINCPSPKLVSQVRSCLGFVSIFHHSFWDLAELLATFTHLTQKDVS